MGRIVMLKGEMYRKSETIVMCTKTTCSRTDGFFDGVLLKGGKYHPALSKKLGSEVCFSIDDKWELVTEKDVDLVPIIRTFVINK
jgi:hypothetical protein